MSDEIKEVIYIGIGLILTASVLLFMSYLIGIRNDFAQARNQQAQTKEYMREHREFNGYNGLEHSADCSKDITSWEVIAIIREYVGDDSIEIYVDRDKDGNELIMNSALVRNNPENYTYQALAKRFNQNNIYHPMLVYDGADPKTTTKPQTVDTASTVTGIRITFIR